MFHILVVDDDKNTRRLFRAVLESENYTVFTASNGLEALEVMDQEHIDLVVLDIMMPEMDGYEFTKELRGVENNLPILMVSAKQLPEDKKQSFLVGTDDYITKPVDEDEMLFRIKALLRRAKIVNERKIEIGNVILDYDALTATRQEDEMVTKKILFIYNPKAGKGKIKNNLLDIIDIFVKAGYSVTAYSTQGQADAQNQVKYREKGLYDFIICSGGDGTLNEVVAGMMQCEEKIPIGYIPAGSTNDFAKSLGISDNMVEAAKEIVEGKSFSCDVGEFNDAAFVYVAAFGLFTEVSYATDQQMKNTLGHMAYILEGVKSLSSIQSYEMQMESEEGTIEGEFIYGMVTNSISVGGIKNITGTNVKLDDGKFEVILIKRPSNPVELNNIVISLVTHNFNSSCIQTFKTSYLKAKSKEKVSWTLDGEFGGNHSEVTIYNRQKAISIIVKCEEK